MIWHLHRFIEHFKPFWENLVTHSGAEKAFEPSFATSTAAYIIACKIPESEFNKTLV